MNNEHFYYLIDSLRHTLKTMPNGEEVEAEAFMAALAFFMSEVASIADEPMNAIDAWCRHMKFYLTVKALIK